MFEIFSQFTLWSFVDVTLIAIIIYNLLTLISGTRAAQMLIGLLFVLLAYILSTVLNLTTLNWIMNKFYSSFIIIMIILFQDDIRHVLRRLGKKQFIPTGENISSASAIDEIVRAVQSLAAKKVGALIVIERNIVLNRYIEVGIELNAKINKEILVSLFQTSSPLHDGAVIIQQGRIAAAGCFLPLTQKENLDPNLGTRHRAAIGVSQETDAIVVVVSEEAGVISLVIDGIISRKLDAKSLRQELRELLLIAEEFDLGENLNSGLQANFVKRISRFIQGIKK